MYPRVNYEMTEKDLEIIYNACKPTTCIMVGGSFPPTPQENANRAWANLGKKMGFDSDTVQPIPGKGAQSFSAVPSETESQRKERLGKEAKEKRQVAIKTLEDEIIERRTKLNELREESV